MFDLSELQTHSIISKMMINEELYASWDQPTRSVIFHDVEHTRLQALAFQLTEKISILAESIERAMEARVGGTGMDLPVRQRDGQEYGASVGGNRWQDGSSYGQGRQGSSDGRMRLLTVGQSGGRSYSRQLRGGNRYDGSYSRRTGNMARGAQTDSSSRMASLNRGGSD
ncbi:hypothetical protein MLD38_029981 [Melastoma candidum]|nr:hypothetical protein MLD38_029981 [Melastoma candidum]